VKKTASFTDKDAKLIEEIQRYQKSKDLSTFVAAVRELCRDALVIKQATK